MSANPIVEGDQIRKARIKQFGDGSRVMHYDDGEILICKKPRNMLDGTPPPSQAELYYWQVMENRPEIKTCDDIKRAREEG